MDLPTTTAHPHDARSGVCRFRRLVMRQPSQTEGRLQSSARPPRARSGKERRAGRPWNFSKRPQKSDMWWRFIDLDRRISEFSTSRGEEELQSGLSLLRRRYRRGEQDKEWSSEELQSVLPNKLDAQLVAHFEQDLVTATTILLEAVRDARFVPSELLMRRMVWKLGERKSTGDRLDAAPGHSTPSVADLMVEVRSGSHGASLADNFGLLFRSILPERQSRRNFILGLERLPWHSVALGLAGSDTAGSTNQDGRPSIDGEDDETDASPVSTDRLSLSWSEKVDKALSMTETAKASGKAHLLGRAVKLREALGSSLQRQEPYQDYLKKTESGLHDEGIEPSDVTQSAAT